ncbi:MAG: SUMF1/EgtB/PvdO family nonheme iron enzyme [Candidatus Cloacimonetes bacterium]|nr:SUMF1/EgtB/PvdO family nonheme iron enzyme [Candidatus Cloacimonadota bacterium]
MPKAESINRVITLKSKADETIEIFPEVQYGTIQVMCIPTDAKINLLGDAGELYTADGRETFTEVPVGNYVLTVSADNHKTHKENISLSADDTVVRQITLDEGSDVPDNMVFVEGGTFQMGSNDGHDNEKPVHSVTLSDFYIGIHEVTQGEYEEVMGKNPSYFKISGVNAPVEKVSWYDVVNYCNKLSDQDGLQRCYSRKFLIFFKCDFSANGYRLPTEAEWEFAARGGNKSKGYKYSGSNDIGSVAWYSSNSGSKTHSVGSKQANEIGIYDMNGSVYEWCWDRYKYNYSSSEQTNPKGPFMGDGRVVRGGSWSNDARDCHVTYRGYFEHSKSIVNLGFRLVRSSK